MQMNYDIFAMVSVFINVYSESKCTVNQCAQWVNVYSESMYTVSQCIQWVKVYSESMCTVSQGVHWVKVYSESRCTVSQGVQWVKVYSENNHHLQPVQYRRIQQLVSIVRHVGICMVIVHWGGALFTSLMIRHLYDSTIIGSQCLIKVMHICRQWDQLII